MTEDNPKKCECCHKTLDMTFGSTKYCSFCSIARNEMQIKINYLNQRVKLLENKYYALKNKVEKKNAKPV